MKNLLTLTLVFILSINAIAQTEKFTKKTWKTFNASFEENLAAAKEFYNGNIDYENRDEYTGMPTPKIKLPNITRSYLDASSYSASNSYEFDSEEKAKEFFNEIMENVKIPKSYIVIKEEGSNSIQSETEEGKHPSVQIEQDDNFVSIRFAPGWDVLIPLDIE